MKKGSWYNLFFFAGFFLLLLCCGVIWLFHVWHNRISVRTVDSSTVWGVLINFNEDEDDKTTKITNAYIGAGWMASWSFCSKNVSLMSHLVSFRFIHLLSLYVSFSTSAIHTIHVKQLSHNMPRYLSVSPYCCWAYFSITSYSNYSYNTRSQFYWCESKKTRHERSFMGEKFFSFVFITMEDSKQ